MLPTENRRYQSLHPCREPETRHVLVEFSKAGFDLLRVRFIVLTIGIPEYLQNGMDIAFAVVWWMGVNMVFQSLIK